MLKRVMNILFYIVAAFYIFMMVDLFFRFSYIFDINRVILRSYNLIPLKTIMEYTSGSSIFDINILGNIAAFIPFGIYIQVIKKRKEFVRSLAVIGATSLSIEIIQFVFGLGVCDIDDVILNIIGGVIGVMVYKLLMRILKSEVRTKTVITVASLIVGVPTIYFYFASVFNHLRL